MKKIIRKLFAPIALLSLALGVGVTLNNHKDVVRTEAATVLYNSFNFLDGGSSSNSGYANTDLATNVSYASDNPGGTSGTTPWEADYANLSLTNATRLGGKLVSAVQTDNTTAWANIKTKFTFPVTIGKVEIVGVTTFGTAGNTQMLYLQSSADSVTWTTVASTTTKSGNIDFNDLTIATNSYLRFGIALKASTTNSGIEFTGIKVYEEASSRALVSIASSGTLTKTSYYGGDTFDPSGLTITATFDDASTTDVTAETTYTPDPLTLGLTSVTASYTFGGVTKTLSISGLTVVAPTFSTAVYDITARNTLTTSGNVPSGSTASIVETYTTTKQMTGGNSQTLTLAGYSNIRITKIIISMRSNASSGAGNLTYSLNGGTDFIDIISTQNFSSVDWNGSYTTSYVDVIKTVDIIVPSSIIIKVAATYNSLYAESYTLHWEVVEAEPLVSLAMNKSESTILNGQTEQFSVTPTPLTASSDVTWSSNYPLIASVDSTGLVTANSVGSAIITATSTENALITASVSISVVQPTYLDKVTAATGLHFGAEYILGSETASKVLSTTITTFGAQVDGVFNSNQLFEDSNFQVLKLVIASETGSYAFQLVNGPDAGKYLALTGDSNALHVVETLDVTSAWNVTFDSNDTVLTSANFTSRTIRYNTGYPRFATYTSGQTAIQLFIKTSTINHTTAANMFVNEVNNGKGLDAQGKCATVYPFLTSIYDRLSVEAKAIYNGSSDETYTNAKNRMAFMAAYVASLPQGSESPRQDIVNKENNIAATAALGVIGLTSILGYYFVSKKKRLV